MKWFMGLLTRHLGTKFLALLLAILLYAFVHKGLSAEREFDLRLHFVLDPNLDREYVLMTPRVDVNGLVLQGLREKLDAWEDGQSKPPEIEISVDQAFIDRHRRGDAALVVAMTTRFFENNKIFARAEITALSVPPAGTDLEIDLRREVTFELTIGDKEQPRLEIAPGSPFSPVGGSGKRVSPEFRPDKRVTISGPKRRLLGVKDQNPKLYVMLQDVNLVIEKQLATLIKSEVTIEAKLQNIDWGLSGLPENKGDRELLRVEDPPDVTIESLAGETKIAFNIQQAKERVVVKAMRLDFEVPGSALLGDKLKGFLNNYDPRRESITLTPSTDWNTCGLHLLVPKSLSDKGEFARGDLFTVIIELPDPAEWKDGEDIEAVVKLTVKDPGNAEALQILQQIEIALNKGEQGPPKVRFTPNPN